MSLIYVLPVALGHLINSLSEAIAATAHDRISLRVVALYQDWCWRFRQLLSPLHRYW